MVGNAEDNFRPVFKYYKSRQPRPDLSTVVTVSPDQQAVVLLSHASQSSVVCPRCCQRAGLRPPQQWRVFALTSNPGLLVIRNPFTPAGQRLWIAKCLTEYPDPPNVNNITNAVQKLQQRTNTRDDASHCLSSGSNPKNASCSEEDRSSSLHRIVACDSASHTEAVGTSSNPCCSSGNDPGCVPPKTISNNCETSFQSNDDSTMELYSHHSEDRDDPIEDAPINPSLKNDQQTVGEPSSDQESTVGCWWRAVLESGGVKSATCQKLRWATLGYHHDWDTKHYSPEKHTPIPPCMATLTATLARGLTLFLPNDPRDERPHINGDQVTRRSGSDLGVDNSSSSRVEDGSCTAVTIPHDGPQRSCILNTSKESSSSDAPSVYKSSISAFTELDESKSPHSCAFDTSTVPLAPHDTTPSVCTAETYVTSPRPAITRTQLLQFRAEAAIVNYYHPGTTLSPHTDISEPNREAPLFSISFGQPCVFLVGGPSRAVTPTPIALHSGDVVVMGGAARLAYHAVPLVTTLDQWRAMAGVIDGEQEPWRHVGNTNKGEGSYTRSKGAGDGKNGSMSDATEDTSHRKTTENSLQVEQDSYKSKLHCCGQTGREKDKNHQRNFAISLEELSYGETRVDKPEAGPLSKGKRRNDSIENATMQSRRCTDDGGSKRTKVDAVCDGCTSLYPENKFCEDQIKTDVLDDALFNEYKSFSADECSAMLEYISCNRINMNIRQVCAPGEVGL